MRDLLLRTFRSLRVRNFRLFFIGQLISSIGLWMQQIAELWLIVELTDSGLQVGLINIIRSKDRFPVLPLVNWKFDN